MLRPGLASTVVLLVTACGSSAPRPAAEPSGPRAAAPAASAVESAKPASESEEEGLAFPTECAKAGDVCVPGGKVAERVCGGVFPGVALALFKKGSPWTRLYLNRTTKAWNASGGASQEVEVVFDEEVVVLRKRAAATGGIQVSGAGASYDVVRWDGSCVTLSEEELTARTPPAPKAAHIEWRYLPDETQEALRTDGAVNETYLARRKECKGATSGTVSKKCEQLDAKLSDVVIAFVRRGGDVPVPAKLP
ncbi:MAG: hypothetical protein OZ921_18395 [Sorangiineae bacterium]|nr:hypothetical protein [Polyangiaceae bacterium]MEB2324491.1 hypothetical protein [Sorangiineae bacterium]